MPRRCDVAAMPRAVADGALPLAPVCTGAALVVSAGDRRPTPPRRPLAWSRQRRSSTGGDRHLDGIRDRR